MASDERRERVQALFEDLKTKHGLLILAHSTNCGAKQFLADAIPAQTSHLMDTCLVDKPTLSPSTDTAASYRRHVPSCRGLVLFCGAECAQQVMYHPV